MSLTALRQAALASRRTYTVGSTQLTADSKRSDIAGVQDGRISERRPDGAPSVSLEPHWQASIDIATD